MNTRPNLRRWAVLAVVACAANAGLRPARAETSGLGPTAPPPNLAAPAPSHVPAPPQPKKVHRKRTGLLAAGAVIFGLSYGGAVVFSALAINCGCLSRDNALDFMIPIIGPAAGGPSHDSGLMLLWGGAQLGGALMLIYGIKGEDVDAGGEVPPARAIRSGPALHLMPLLARDAGGMVLTGRW